MAAILVGMGIYFTLALLTCALVGARRAKLRKCIEPRADQIHAVDVTHRQGGYAAEALAGARVRR